MKEKTEHYSADKPISDKTLDRFQRFNFSKRIAETIIQRNSDESIVFGLFGAWGEGKSTVINFIDGVLQEEVGIITIHLNPWRYTDEESLLYNFFDRIAKALDKELNTKKEKAASLVEKYGGFTKFFGIDHGDISKAIADTNLEDFKERVDGFLSESSKRLVIFIDDIDRLDKQEISVLFRLIKLTADFSKTIYILSFDETMVAASIGERFGNGDVKAGENFLEKIIQVPLVIPKAQPDALKKFCIDLLNNALEINNIDLTQDEANKFVYQFSNNILPRLDTPRLAVRYSNTVSFSLPLLIGEVNTVDLMLIEAIKVFYPDYYKFIKDYPDYFLGSYKSNSIYGGRTTDQSKIENLKNKFKTLSHNLKKRQRESIEELLTKLFPKLQSALNNYHYDRNSYEKWQKEKRICSGAYFERYFSYTVIEGEISDVEFDQFLNELSTNTNDRIILEIEELADKSSLLKLIEKLQTNGLDIDWEDFKKLAFALCQISNKLDSRGTLMNLRMDSSLKQTVIFIFKHLEKNKDKPDLFETSKEIMVKSNTVDFIIELMDWLDNDELEENKMFSVSQYKEFNQILVSKALSTLQTGENIITKFPENNRLLLNKWYNISKKEVKQNISNFLNEENHNVLSFLWVFTPLIYSSATPKPYKGDLTIEAFNEMAKFISHNDLKRRLTKLFGKKELNKEEVSWDGRNSGNHEINLVRQFLYHFTANKNNGEPQ